MMIITHRGASAYAPENTLPAFKKAVGMGAKAFEFDVHRTKDGILVVHHDYSLEKTAGAQVNIADLTYAELSKYNVAKHFGPAWPAERVPRLEEVMEIINPAATWLNFEIKNDKNVYPGIEEQVVDFLHSRPGLMQKSLVSTFDNGTLKRFRALSPEVKLGYLGHHLNTVLLLPALRRAKAVGATNFHLALRIAFKLNVSRIKKAGFRVGVYTVNTKKDAARMKAIGVDLIFSNYPDLLSKP